MAQKLKHRVRIQVQDDNGQKRTVLKAGTKRVPYRLFRWLFGDFAEILVLTPGRSVEEIEIYKLPKEVADAPV